ncbi:MAG TPA: hypothetical protein VGB24_21240 [Longimicrobium sp.]|jgi:HEAT repeat protein|uniref:hypothetical protein n=1 Tax=Longimicrobium sp. TaxID=2029185 RepID=UPI002ED7D128
MNHPVAASPSGERLALSRGLANFLVELAIALQHHGVYPAGHPFLARSAEGVVRRLDTVLLDRASLSFGVARRQLVIEGVATDESNPVLSGLADRLHRHRVGAVTLRRGLDVDEVSAFLCFLARETEPGRPPREWGNEGWPHASLHSLSYAQLELTGDGAADDGHATAGVRAAQLWVGLARAALASGTDTDETPEPAVVAKAIEQNAHAVAYDQVIVGYLLQLAQELRTEGGRGSAEVRRRMSDMLERLNPATIKRLLEMGGDGVQRRRFLLDASHGFASDAVVRLVEIAAESEGQTISNSLVRLLNKLATHAGEPAGTTRAAADAALREQVEALVGGWGLADPNPQAYTRVLDGLSTSLAGIIDLLPGPNSPEPERILETALEVGGNGPTVWAAVQRMEAAGQLHRVVQLLSDAPGHGGLVEAGWAYACRPDGVRRLLREGADASSALHAVLARTGAEAVPALLDELAESESRTVRRATVDRLVALGPAALPEIGRRMADERWYLIRNLLSIVAGLGAAPDGFSAAPFLRHEDERVRREAFKAALRLGGERERVLGLALTDPDTQVLRLALADCADACPAPVLPLVCRRIDDPATEPEVRALAARVLGGSREPIAVATLVRVASAGRTLLGRVRLAHPTPEVLAAIAALGRGWAQHPAAQPVLDAARRSGHPEVLRLLTTSPATA